MSADIVRSILRGLWDQYQTGGQDLPRAQDVNRDRESFLITGMADNVPVIVTVSERVPPEEDLDEPARPVEDREPVGPYAPTRTPNLDDRAQAAPEQFEAGYRQGWGERHFYGTPRYKGLPTLTDRPEGGTELGDYLVEQFGAMGHRISALVNAVETVPSREWHNQRAEHLLERFDVLTNAIERLSPDNGYWSHDAEQGRLTASYDRGVAAGRASSNRTWVPTTDGSCSWPPCHAPENAEHRDDCPIYAAGQRGFRAGQGSQTPYREGFENGRKIGQSEREAELLDQGWTPPGATEQPEVIVSEYAPENAVVIGSFDTYRDGTDMAIDGDETSWGPMATIDPANTPINEPRD